MKYTVVKRLHGMNSMYREPLVYNLHVFLDKRFYVLVVNAIAIAFGPPCTPVAQLSRDK